MDHIEEVVNLLEGIKEEMGASATGLSSDADGEVVLTIYMPNDVEIQEVVTDTATLYDEEYINSLLFKASREYPWASSTLH